MMQKEKWRIWEKYHKYGEVLFKRAIGESEEMESSKALCDIIKPFYKPGMRVLDVGCGAGHYLRSLRKRIDANIDYTGVDATENYLALAKKAFPNVKFIAGDIFNLPFTEGAFDLVMCNNVILHLPPPPVKPISELLRVSKKFTVIRTLFGQETYIIKEIRTAADLPGLAEREGDLIRSDGEVDAFNYFNLYSERYVRDVLERLVPSAHVEITSDRNFRAFDNRQDCGSTATAVVNGMQVSGNIIHDSRFVIITK